MTRERGVALMRFSGGRNQSRRVWSALWTLRMPLDNRQGYCAAPGWFYPCAGLADGFDIPPKVAQVSVP